jgi:hypothetical protein
MVTDEYMKIMSNNKILLNHTSLYQDVSYSCFLNKSYLNVFAEFLFFIGLNLLRTEVYFCHQNQNAKTIGNFTTPFKSHNIGTHLKGIETSFQVLLLFLKSFHFWVSYITFCNFLKITRPGLN